MLVFWACPSSPQKWPSLPSTLWKKQGTFCTPISNLCFSEWSRFGEPLEGNSLPQSLLRKWAAGREKLRVGVSRYSPGSGEVGVRLLPPCTPLCSLQAQTISLNSLSCSLGVAGVSSRLGTRARAQAKKAGVRGCQGQSRANASSGVHLRKQGWSGLGTRMPESWLSPKEQGKGPSGTALK